MRTSVGRTSKRSKAFKNPFDMRLSKQKMFNKSFKLVNLYVYEY